MSPYPRKPRALGCGVRTAAGISSTVSIPVELVTPTAIGSSATHVYGTTIVLERSRSSVAGPSSVNGTIASSTVTDAIVRSSRCGFRTWMRISPSRNSTRRMSNSSAGGGEPPSRSTTRSPCETTNATASASSTIGTSAQSRQPRPPPTARRRFH